MPKFTEFKDIIGMTFANVIGIEDRIIFEGSRNFELYHEQDCCEDVRLEDICGDLKDLVNSPILRAEERFNSDKKEDSDGGDSETWSFYELATNKGSVTIRFYGTSNGYYSETAKLYEIG